MFELVLGAAVLLVALVTGLLLGFVVVAMPGIGVLDDRSFLRSFQVMDRVIQDGHPLFMATWVGSVLAVLAAMGLGLGEAEGGRRVLLLASGAVYLLGLQLPTAAINIPLNNAVQALDLATAPDDDVAEARAAFEARWNRWNAIRTAMGCLAAAGLLWVLGAA